MEQYIKDLASQWLTAEDDKNALEFIKALDYYSLSYYFEEFLDNPNDLEAFQMGLETCIELNKVAIFENKTDFYIHDYLYNLNDYLTRQNYHIYQEYNKANKNI